MIEFVYHQQRLWKVLSSVICADMPGFWTPGHICIKYCCCVMLLGDTEAIQDYYYGATPYLAYTDRWGMDKSKGIIEGSYLSWLSLSTVVLNSRDR